MNEHCYHCESPLSRFVQTRAAPEDAYRRCEKCGLVQLSRRYWPADQEAHYSGTYYPEGYAPPRKNRTALFSYRFRNLKRYLPPPGLFLEVGAGSGGFLDFVRDAGYEARGVELSRRAAEWARRNYGLEVFHGTLEQAKFASDAFEYVAMYHVLEHIPDPLATLTEAHRVLKRGGRLLLEVPNIESAAVLVPRLRESILHFPHHLYAFSARALREMLSLAGFRILAWEYSFAGADFLSGLRLIAKGEAAARAREAIEPDGKKLLASAHPGPFWKRALARLLPGMKLTVVAEKYL